MLGSEREDNETASGVLPLSSSESDVQADRTTPVQRAPAARTEVPKKLCRFMEGSMLSRANRESSVIRSMWGLSIMFVRRLDSKQCWNRGIESGGGRARRGFSENSRVLIHFIFEEKVPYVVAEAI